MRANDDPLRVAICVCTYRRPKVLEALLHRLEVVTARAEGLADVTFVVVDDDPAGSARDVVDALRARVAHPIVDVVSGSGNISTARNRSLDEGMPRADFLAITDDDCMPHDDWLAELVRVQRRFDADIVSGRCIDIAPPGSPRWYVDEPWLAPTPAQEEGERLDIGPLKNSFLRVAALAEHGLRFDEGFGLSGGEDALFMREAGQRGLDHRHAPGAVVDEDVPIERVTVRYQFRRALWYGNSEARTSIAGRAQARHRIALSSLKRIALGPAHAAARLADRQSPQWRWAAAISLTGVGRLIGAAGVTLLHSTINHPRRVRDRIDRSLPLARLGGITPRTGMFAVVIPTLQQSPLLDQLVAQYCAHPLVAEVVIINNASPTPLVIDDPKVKIVDPGGNIFVNPAWNLGVEESWAGHLIISNDDLLLPDGLIDSVAGRLGDRVGIIGAHFHCFEQPPSGLRFHPAYDRTFAFGTVMFMARADYVRIPEELKIWYGDDWLFNHQRRPNLVFSGVEIVSPMSVTSGQPRFNAQKDEDARIFEERYSASPYRERFRIQRGLARRAGLVGDRLRRR